MRRIAIILGLGEVLAALVFWWLLQHDEMVFMLIALNVFGLLMLCLSPIAVGPAAIISIRIALKQIHHGRGFDQNTLRYASLAFRNNRDLRELAILKDPAQVPIDLVHRIEEALPALENRAARRLRIMMIVMIACMVAGAFCRFMGSVYHN